MVRFFKQFLSINQNEIVPRNFWDFIASNIEAQAHSLVARLDLQIVKWYILSTLGLSKFHSTTK